MAEGYSITWSDLSKPYNEMSKEAKEVYKLALKKADEEQAKLLEKAKQQNG